MDAGAVRAYLLDLQERIVARMEALDGGRFVRDEWTRAEGGGRGGAAGRALRPPRADGRGRRAAGGDRPGGGGRRRPRAPAGPARAGGGRAGGGGAVPRPPPPRNPYDRSGSGHVRAPGGRG